jgi:hypothetical protein
MQLTVTYFAKILHLMPVCLTPSTQRNCVMAHCSRMLQFDSRVSMFTVTASAIKTMECCAIHVQTCQGPVTIGWLLSLLVVP